MICDRCEAEARWLVWATYEVGYPDDVHPRLARYPAPMARTCAVHLAAVLVDDLDLPTSTAKWAVTPCP